jgi:hypothetical protein
MISMKKDIVDYSPKWVGAIYFSAVICGLDLKDQDRIKTFVILDQP